MDLLKKLTATDIIRARKENRLEELLPSGASIPFKFTTGEKNSFDVGRDSRYTYLILHDIVAGSSVMNNAPVNEGGWPASRMRNVIRDLFQSLPGKLLYARTRRFFCQQQISLDIILGLSVETMKMRR